RVRPHADAHLVLAGRRDALSSSCDRRAQPRDREVRRRARCRARREARSGGGARMSAKADTARRGALECTAAAKAYQKAFGAELKSRVVDGGEPFAVAQADTPHEIFHAMDIPIVSNQWW